MLQKKHRLSGLILSVLASALLLGAALFILFNRQHVIDQMTVWQYKPANGVTELVERAGMNDHGKFLYLASQPVLDATQDFNKVCDRIEQSASILGCYSNYRIYIYDVSDPKLDGIREVTAAHETLHAAYLRMSDSEKSKIDALLEVEYKKLENDKNLKDRMAFYARTEPGQRNNELHSVIGTEVANISPALENHYSKYFADRQKVVDLNNKYSGVFEALNQKVEKIGSTLRDLSISIANQSAQYNMDVAALNKDIQSFNRRAVNGQFASQAQFYSERAALSGRVAQLESTRREISSDIATYESLLIEYNAIASESKKLYNSIDSTLAPAPSV